MLKHYNVMNLRLWQNSHCYEEISH